MAPPSWQQMPRCLLLSNFANLTRPVEHFNFHTMISRMFFSWMILVIGSNDGRETKRNSSSSKQIHFAISRLVVCQKGSCAKSSSILLSDFLTFNSSRRSCLVWWRVVRYTRQSQMGWCQMDCVSLSLWKRWIIRHLVRCCKPLEAQPSVSLVHQISSLFVESF